MSDDLAGVRIEQLRGALRLLGGGIGGQAPQSRQQVARDLRRLLREPGLVRAVLADAPEGGRRAFAALATSGPRSVEALLGRGWWGRGVLPPPLDWLQQRLLIVVDDDGLIRAVDAAVQGWRTQRLEFGDTETRRRDRVPDTDSHEVDDAGEGGVEEPRQPQLVPVSGVDGRPAEPLGPQPVAVEAAASIVVAEHPEDLDRLLGIGAAGLRAVAPTVAVSRLKPDALTDVLRGEGVALRSDAEVSARSDAPALPLAAERAVTPWDLRSLFERAIDENRQIHLVYYPSSRGGAATERTVDPWAFADDLLTGYCHLRDGERTFALDRVGAATLLPSHLEHPPGR